MNDNVRLSRVVRDLHDRLNITPEEKRIPLSADMLSQGTTMAQLVAVIPDVARVGLIVDTIKYGSDTKLCKQLEWLECVSEPQDSTTFDGVISVTLNKRDLLKDLFVVTTKLDLMELMNAKLVAGVVSGLGIKKSPKKKLTPMMMIYIMNTKKLMLRATGMLDSAKKNLYIGEGDLLLTEHHTTGTMDKNQDKMEEKLREFWLDSSKYALQDFRSGSKIFHTKDEKRNPGSQDKDVHECQQPVPSMGKSNLSS